MYRLIVVIIMIQHAERTAIANMMSCLAVIAKVGVHDVPDGYIVDHITALNEVDPFLATHVEQLIVNLKR